jgi:hypothetical protein
VLAHAWQRVMAGNASRFQLHGIANSGVQQNRRRAIRTGRKDYSLRMNILTGTIDTRMAPTHPPRMDQQVLDRRMTQHGKV